jgi:hypothetical protein
MRASQRSMLRLSLLRRIVTAIVGRLAFLPGESQKLADLGSDTERGDQCG